MKKFIAMASVLFIALSLTACSDNKAEKEKKSVNTLQKSARP